MHIPRLSWWLITTIVLLIVIALLAPQQLPVSLYKLSLVSMAGVAGYWLDRELFPYARPDSYLITPYAQGAPVVPDTFVRQGYELIFAASTLRRSIIVGCAMLAIGLGA